MADVKKGDVVIAGGTAKRFKVESVSKDDIATLKEIQEDTPESPAPEELLVPVKTIVESDDWIGQDEKQAA